MGDQPGGACADIGSQLPYHAGVEALFASNGTIVIHLALEAARVCGTVLTTPFSFVAKAARGVLPLTMQYDRSETDVDRIVWAIHGSVSRYRSASPPVGSEVPPFHQRYAAPAAKLPLSMPPDHHGLMSE